MNDEGLQLMSLLLVFLVFFLDKTEKDLSQFLSQDWRLNAGEDRCKSVYRDYQKFFIQVGMGIILELGILTIYCAKIINIISNSKVSLVKPDVSNSLSVLIYICMLGLLLYSTLMLKDLCVKGKNNKLFRKSTEYRRTRSAIKKNERPDS